MRYIFPIESYAGDPIQLVPVIASYDTEGHVKPKNILRSFMHNKGQAKPVQCSK